MFLYKRGPPPKPRSELNPTLDTHQGVAILGVCSPPAKPCDRRVSLRNVSMASAAAPTTLAVIKDVSTLNTLKIVIEIMILITRKPSV